MTHTRTFKSLSFALIALWAIATFCPKSSIADTASDLQQKIDANNATIQSLNKEILGYQKQIDSLGSESTSLAQAIKSLDLTKLELDTNIKMTETKISAKALEIQQLESQIANKQGNISDDERFIGNLFTTMGQTPDDPLVLSIIGSRSISQAYDSVEHLGLLQNDLLQKIHTLTNDKRVLEDNKTETENAKVDLVTLRSNLANQKSIVISTTQQKNSLLKDTNQSEASYRRMMAEKSAQMESLQQEIQDFESQLHLNVNSSLLPHTGSGVLSWPLDSIRITQYFGNTPFSTANPQIYNGKGHTGVDFAASIGTPVKAALSGQIVGIGNTDLYKGCYSFGKWVMIKHNDGLSTLYAHLSIQDVNTGDTVMTGQIIGYSGNTGYTTGPHLHFGVYATQGVELKLFSTSKNCKGAIIPVADYSAYLNPLSYL